MKNWYVSLSQLIQIFSNAVVTNCQVFTCIQASLKPKKTNSLQKKKCS